jgi:hypothetical protein
MPSDVPQPPKKRQNPTNVIALLIVLGVIFVALWIVFTLLSDVFDAAKEGYGAIHVRRNSVIDLVFGVAYGLYTAGLFFGYGMLMLEKFSIIASVRNRQRP